MKNSSIAVSLELVKNRPLDKITISFYLKEVYSTEIFIDVSLFPNIMK